MKEGENFIYRFGSGLEDGNSTMKNLLGGKGANLAEMSSIGLPVPPGFTLSAEICQLYSRNGKDWPEGLESQVEKGIHHIEGLIRSQFGGSENPLLVSVRSGAAISMPGMMDTILNLGLNDETVEALAKKTDNRRFALDCYRRFIEMFGNVVMHIPQDKFENVFERLKSEKGVKEEKYFTPEHLEELISLYKEVYYGQTGDPFVQDPFEQLEYAVYAVVESWFTPRAVTYRKINNISGLLGTAVTVQAMVFGNMGDDSATGVCFTRNPSDGNNELFGEFLINAQGEDVVAGIRTPVDIGEMKKIMPDQFKELSEIGSKLELHFRNMQDIEFTIQQGQLFILQTRNGKRTGLAALKIAVDMVKENLITENDAVLNLVEPVHLEKLLHTQLKTEQVYKEDTIGRGLPASPGAAVGKVVFSSEKVAESTDPVILVRIQTSSDDVSGMSAAEGILTSHGGKTSHAAVVARGWGKPCVAGCEDIIIDYEKGSVTNGKITLYEGDWISIDGGSGIIFQGQKDVVKPNYNEDFFQFMEWVDQYCNMEVRANADTPLDAERAKSFGAKGIGLCRTEHMFFGGERITAMRRMIISETEEERKDALSQLLIYQKEDFLKIFEVMGELPVTIRLLDPPLHEFLPEEAKEIEQVAKELRVGKEEFLRKISSLKEVNPMLGHRGCRLGITYPEITEMQTRAIIEAALELKKKGKTLIPEIMIPLVGTAEEFVDQRNVIENTCRRIFNEKNMKLDYKIGTMIEIPRATIVAKKIAEKADFFSFGTNDLTQMTYGYSRDDTGKFMEHYIQKNILPEDPFQVLDVEGVGRLITLAVENGRKHKTDLKIGICGEHGGDPRSINFFQSQHLDYVSCSPYRVPVARLAAAQALLNEESAIALT